MTWWGFGWRNLWRNKLRTTLQLIAIAGGIFLTTFAANLQKGSWDKVIEDGVRAGSGHVAVYHEKYLTERKADQVFPTERLLSAIASDSRLSDSFARLYVPGLARSSHESRSSIIIGIDLEREKANNPVLEPRRTVRGELPIGSKRNMAYIGEKLAMQLQVDVGNKLVLMFQDLKGEITSKLYRVSGIFRTHVTQMDSNFIFVDRGILAESLGQAQIAHEIGLIVNKAGDIPDILHLVSRTDLLPVGAKGYRWQEAMPELASAVAMDHFQLMLMLCILYSVIGIGAVNTLLMSVLERTREFGLFRAIGLRASHIRKIVMAEAFCLSVSGIVLGLFTSCLASLYTWTYGLDFTFMLGNMEVAGIMISPIIYSGWDIQSMVVMSSIMVLIVLAGSLYPARKALQINPAEAMRKF